MTFPDLGLSAPILSALEEQGYSKPSPIQEKAIPPALAGRDVLGCAQTGTGKTCAFASPILQRLSVSPVKGRPIRALILTPTRELAIQIGESFDAYGKHLPLRCAVIFGGVGQGPQADKLRQGVDILVATPGRLGDLYQQKLLDLSRIEIFVLDEADRMLDMGFIHDVKKILTWLPEKKQTMLFSATMPGEIAQLAGSLLHRPARVAVDPVSSPVEAIRQSVCFVDRANKTRLLARLVEELDVKNALVFTRTKHGANKVARDLVKQGISAAAIHGNKSQTARQQALGDFKNGKIRCLVATDIAARGLDIEELSHVFNYNLPEVPETYIHRIGRTGRAGHGGTAVSFCDFGETSLLKDIEKLIGRPVPVVEGHPFPMQVFEAPQRDKNGKLINPEDAEARQAAKDRRLERDAARRAAEAEMPAPPEMTAPAPSARKRRRNRGQAVQETVSALQKPAVKPFARQPLSSDAPAVPPEPPARPKLTRPGTRMDTGDAMPRTDFFHPDPLAGDRIMDATARLLAPRKPMLSAAPSPGRAGKEEPAGTGAKKRKTAPSGREKALSPEPERAGSAWARRNQGKSALQAAAPPRKEKPSVAPGQRLSRKHRTQSVGRRTPPAQGAKSGQTKDSTEQKSLMKPFYLDP